MTTKRDIDELQTPPPANRWWTHSDFESTVKAVVTVLLTAAVLGLFAMWQSVTSLEKQVQTLESNAAALTSLKEIVVRLEERVKTLDNDLCGMRSQQLSTAQVTQVLSDHKSEIAELRTKVDEIYISAAQATERALITDKAVDELATVRERVAALEANGKGNQ